jgi:5'-nucleotidase
VVVGTNDFHGYLKPNENDVQGHKLISGGAEWFAGYVKILQDKYGDHLVMLDGGDLFQGTLESNFFYGKPVMDYYNLLPYRAAAVGNHEFDYGPGKNKGGKDRLAALKSRMRQAKFPFVQANIVWKKSGKLWREKNLFPSVLVKAGGYKVGIIGLTTPTTPAKTLPTNVVPLEFRKFLEPTLREAKALRARGAEIVLITTHEGSEGGTALRTMLEKIAPGTIDAVVSGHSHQEVHEFVNGTPVIQSRTRGLFFGRIDLYVNKATRKVDRELSHIAGMTPICGTWYHGSEDCNPRTKEKDLFPLRHPAYEGVEVQPNLKVRAVLAPYFARTDKLKKEVLGHAKSNFEFYPTGESQVGFLFCRAFQEKFPYAKVIFHNGGGIRRNFLAGPITYGDLYEVHPFDNYAVAVKMNGAQLKDLMRVGVSGSQSLPLFIGVRASYYTDDSPAYLRDVNGDGKKELWERDRLKSLVWEKTGKPVADTDEFWLATNDYLVAGGDNTAHVFGSIPSSRRRYLDITTRDLVADYLRKHPGLSLPQTDEPRLRKAN